MAQAEVSVSVVVLTFNSAAFVARCLNSLCAQTYRDFEVLVVDAGSIDRTREIVQQYDDRFRFFDLPDSDMGTARNFGASKARGRYLCFLDSDDIYLPRKIEVQVEALDQAPEIAVHFCRAYHFRTGRPDRVGWTKQARRPRDEHWYLAGNNENLNTMCMRRATWESGYKFGEGDRGRYGEEWRQQLAMSLGGLTMAYCSEFLVVVELRPDSHTSWERQWVMKQQAIDEIRRVVTRRTVQECSAWDIRSIFDSLQIKLVFALLLAGSFSEAKQAARQVTRGRHAWILGAIAESMSWLPTESSRQIVQRLWIWRQNRRLHWQPASPEVSAALADLNPSHGHS